MLSAVGDQTSRPLRVAVSSIAWRSHMRRVICQFAAGYGQFLEHLAPGVGTVLQHESAAGVEDVEEM